MTGAPCGPIMGCMKIPTETPDAWPEAGSVVEHAVGELIVLASSRDTGGEMVEVEAICRPGLPGVGERSFDEHQVRFEVLEGSLLIEVEGRGRMLCSGEAVTLPAGTPHRISTPPDRSAARFIWQMRPAPRDAGPADLVFGEPS